MSRTMAFVPESEPQPGASPPAAGRPAAPPADPDAGPRQGRRLKGLSATMAFGDPGAELQKAARKMVAEAEQKLAAQEAAGGAPEADQGPAKTMAFGAVDPDLARSSDPGQRSTMPFGAISPEAPSAEKVSAPQTAARRRRKGLSATIAFGETPEEVEKAIGKAEEAAAAKKRDMSRTMAFEARPEPQRTTPVPPGPGQRTTPVPPGSGQRTTPVPPGPGERTTPVPPGPQGPALSATAPPATQRRKKSSFTSTVAFEAPSELAEAARAEPEAPHPEPAKPAANLASTLAFEAPSEIAAQAADAPDESDLAATLAYDRDASGDIAEAQRIAGQMQKSASAARSPTRKRTMIGGIGALPSQGTNSPAVEPQPAAAAPAPLAPPAGAPGVGAPTQVDLGGPVPSLPAGAPGAEGSATAQGIGQVSGAMGQQAPAMGQQQAGVPGREVPAATTADGPPVFDAMADVGGPSHPLAGPGDQAASQPVAGGHAAAPQPGAMAAPGGYPAAPRGQQANTPTLAPPKRNTGIVVGIVVVVILLLLTVILALWSFVT